MFLLLQQIIPINPGTVDQVSWVTAALDQLTNGVGNLYIGTVRQLFPQLGVLAIALAGIYLAYSWLVGHHNQGARHCARVFIILFLVDQMLRYYTAPMPLIGYTIPDLFHASFRWLAAAVDIRILDQFLQMAHTIFGNTEKPAYWNLPALAIYLLVLINMAVVEGALFIVTIYSFVAIAIGICWGPFAILALVASLIFPFLGNIFYAWVNYMIKYGLFRVVAAMLVFVWCTVIMTFIQNTLHGDYSIGHWWAIIIPFSIINLACAFTVLTVPALTNDLLTGGAYAGTGFAGTFMGFFRR
jgi:hypothetical protein